MKMTIAALTAAAIVLFGFSQAHAGTIGLHKATNAHAANAAIVHKTGSLRRRGRLSRGFAYGIAAASSFIGARRFDDFGGRGRNFRRNDDCLTGARRVFGSDSCGWNSNRGDFEYAPY